jgi:NAD(P)-dependent dehydrogenase (short-subunit alcohol dehydrogenase family)
MEKTVLVTGALGDIGWATAQKFAAGGWKVVLNDLDPLGETARQRAEQCQVESGMRFWSADNTDRAAVDAMLADIEVVFGLPTLAIVNAGVVMPMPFLEMTVENWDRHLHINLTGAFHVAQAVARRMVAVGTPGQILFTGSWVQDVPDPNIPAYCVSKSGLKMLAKVMAAGLAKHGIRVNTVAPGVVDAGLSAQMFRAGKADPAQFTRYIPLGALQTAEQVADAFWLLAQPEADYITGTTLLADGGGSLFQFKPSP